MKLFLGLTLLIFGISVTVTFFAFLNYKAFLDAPLVYKLLIGIGLLTPLANIYDTLKTFVLIGNALSSIKNGEE